LDLEATVRYIRTVGFDATELLPNKEGSLQSAAKFACGDLYFACLDLGILSQICVPSLWTVVAGHSKVAEMVN